MNAAHYMGVFDVDLIMSWTPHEYKLLLRGAQHRIIDKHEFIAKTAMANRYAQNAKQARETSIFNAEKARRMIDGGYRGNIGELEKERFTRMKNALKNYKVKFTPSKEGGR